MNDETRPPVRRRSFLAAGLGGLAAALAGVLARPAQVDAANGDAVRVGRYHTGSNATSISVAGDPALKCASSGHDGLWGQSRGANRSGVYGSNSHATGYGVTGRNTANGTFGWLGGPTGVQGRAPWPRSALEVQGAVRFSRCGVLWVEKGSKTATQKVDAVQVTTPNAPRGTLCFAMLQHPEGDNYVKSAFINNSGEIQVTLAQEASLFTPVGWFMLD
jgi:hypothetical protein